MKTEKSILLIIPYFGQWPIWIELFADSIKRNPTVHFLIITDCEPAIFNDTLNVKVEKTTFFEYIQRFKLKLGSDIQIPNPYKICDLRPFFGIIHEEDIKGYDFYGWTDVDILFGDIRRFYTNDILEKHEVLSSHHMRLAGHFALLRNSTNYKQIGYKIYNWKSALQNPEFVGIDEHGMTNALTMTIFDKIAEKFGFSKNNVVLNWFRKLKTRKFYFVEQYTTPFTLIPWIDGTVNSYQPNEWFYNQGSITNSRDGDRKFMYLHFMNFKSSKWRHDGTNAPWDVKENTYLISSEDFKKRITISTKGIHL
jgi:hypothetical protein